MTAQATCISPAHGFFYEMSFRIPSEFFFLKKKRYTVSQQTGT